LAHKNQKTKVYEFMKYDLHYHLSEISEGTMVDYFSVSKAVNELIFEGKIDRLSIDRGVYVKYSPKGRIKENIKLLMKEIRLLEETEKDIKLKKQGKIQEFKLLKDKYDKMIQDQ
jgi:hypothetical protein